MNVTLDAARRLVLQTSFSLLDRVKGLPDRRLWDGKTRAWRAAASRVNIEYIRRVLPELTWHPDAQAYADQVIAHGTPPVPSPTGDYRFADPPPYAHQREGFGRVRDVPAYALLMEQRTGKTRVTIDNACDLYARGKIDLVLVICPNNVKSTWEEQIPQWSPTWCPTAVTVYRAAKKDQVAKELASPTVNRLRWLVVNCELLSTGGGEDWLIAQLKNRRVLAVVDEATRFKHPGSSRSKTLLRLRKLCAYRRILTGTLITQGPLDAYVPFAFLDPAILGYSTFSAFRNDFAILGGYNGKQVIEYVNTDRLAELIKGFSYRVTRDQCFDLPPKIYSRLDIELGPEQRRLYNQMRDTMLAELDEESEDPSNAVSATIVLTQLLRLQQIVGGFLPPAEEGGEPRPIPGKNAKLEALLEELEETQGKVIIWARFRAELAMLSQALRAAYGDLSVVEFHGGIDEELRTLARRRFQDDKQDPCRFFIGQQDAGGIGIDLSRASTVVYYSNSFSLENRLQSEDRAQSGSKQTSTSYLDLIARDTLDVKVIAALRGKKKLADVINRDTVKDWI